MYWDVFDLEGMPRHAGLNSKGLPQILTLSGARLPQLALHRKSVFDQVGGFDTTYRNGYEDVDLCLRLSRKGYRHYVANHSRIFHHVSKSPGRKLHEDRNAKIFIERWGRTYPTTRPESGRWSTYVFAGTVLQKFV